MTTRAMNWKTLALALVMTGCGSSGPAAPSVSPQAQQEARSIFETRCVTCHGPRGAGDGPAASGLNPHPRNFTDSAWQESVTNDHIAKIIVGGGAAVGKSPLMPPNPDLQGKTEVVNGLVAHIRGLSR